MLERGKQLLLGDRVEAVPAQPAHLGGEVGGIDGQAPGDPRQRGAEVVDPVVHEDRDGDRTRRERVGQAERRGPRTSGADFDRDAGRRRERSAPGASSRREHGTDRHGGGDEAE